MSESNSKDTNVRQRRSEKEMRPTSDESDMDAIIQDEESESNAQSTTKEKELLVIGVVTVFPC
uniref:Uncharacterized protein n=1 Tax=Heterorhabditis bacteriophora TaxID=37862 RepID=A0A1I7XBQ2_HETBA